MKSIYSKAILVIIVATTFFLTACTDETNQATSDKEASGEHVWQTQTDALQTAKDMANQLQQNLDLQKEKLDQESK